MSTNLLIHDSQLYVHTPQHGLLQVHVVGSTGNRDTATSDILSPLHMTLFNQKEAVRPANIAEWQNATGSLLYHQRFVPSDLQRSQDGQRIIVYGNEKEVTKTIPVTCAIVLETLHCDNGIVFDVTDGQLNLEELTSPYKDIIVRETSDRPETKMRGDIVRLTV